MNGHTVYVKDFSVNTGDKIWGRVMSNHPVKSHLRDMMVEIWSLMRACSSIRRVMQHRLQGSSSVRLVHPVAACSLHSVTSCRPGAMLTVTYISLSTQASSRTIMATADVPVALTYSINAHGVNTATGTIPAIRIGFRIHENAPAGRKWYPASPRRQISRIRTSPQRMES